MRILFIFFFSWTSLLFSKPDQNTFDSNFSTYLRSSLEQFETAGMAVAIIRDDELLYAEGFGVHSLVNRAPVTADTLFSMGSITKGFTTALLGMLVDEGKLNWDDLVTQYLPDFRLHNSFVTKEFTILDLLTHRSGLADHAGDLLFLSKNHPEMVERLRFLEPVSGFRAVFSYQNLMYLVAGQVIETITGKPWHEVLQERILEPLGMHHTNLHPQTLEGNKNAVEGHARVDDLLYLVPWKRQVDFGPAGALSASVMDMTRWMRFMLGDGTWNGKRLMSEEAMKHLLSYEMPVPFTEWVSMMYPTSHFLGYGLGWFSFDWHGQKVIEHGGNMPGLTAKLTLVPSEKLAILVVVNQHLSLLPHAITLYTLEHYHGIEPKNWSAFLYRLTKMVEQLSRTMERSIQAERKTGTQASLSLSGYTGSYFSPLYGKVAVSRKGKDLVMSFDGALTADLQHWQDDTWRVHWRDLVPRFYPGKVLLNFHLSSTGQVTGLDIEQIGSFSRF
ncbi:MAG: hypothetical protein CMO81_11115 [Waddliaceae bacterium]|nr:hypothetical protein [Waddliaceae bacterium]